MKEKTEYILYKETGEIEDEQKEALNLECTIKNATKGTIIEFPYLFYPGYTITLNDGTKTISLKTFESKNGFLTVVLPEDVGQGKIELDYTGTTLEIGSYVISAISLVGFIIYIILYKRKIKLRK